MESVTKVQTLNEAVYVSFCGNAREKDMDLFVLNSNYEYIVG